MNTANYEYLHNYDKLVYQVVQRAEGVKICFTAKDSSFLLHSF